MPHEMNSELHAAVEKHVAKELRNALLYLAAYSWARAKGWEGFSKRWKNAAVEEIKHAQNFLKFCARYSASVKPWPETDSDDLPDSVEGVAGLEKALEVDTLHSMNDLAVLADEVGDMAAVEWVSTKLEVQQKDAKKSADFARLVAEAARSGNGALVILDREMERKGW